MTANPLPATAAISEALAVLRAGWAEACYSAQNNYTIDPHQHIERLIQAGDALLASLSPEAAPVPAEMPQIEVGDWVQGGDIGKVFEVAKIATWNGEPAYLSDFVDGKPPCRSILVKQRDVAAVRKANGVIWRREEAKP